MMMKKWNLKQDPDCRYVEFSGRVHLFFSGDKNLPQTEETRVLDELENLGKGLDGFNNNGQETSDERQLHLGF